MNKAIICGNLGSDPELKNTKSGTAVCNFSVATNERWTDKRGQKQERTEWHRIVCWDRLAETCSTYLTKGRQVLVEGKIQTSEWEDRDGNKRYTTEIVANSVHFLSGGDAPARDRAPKREPSQPAYDQPYNDDDIPF